ncbi:3-hydroxyacyl-ACP dehydratase FabZ [Streptomyces sp. ODS05-4]|uniref:3-hydroxyacyl-ACP dehydratase FabZ n=1 Tax=Streptomyces sp. ODS05-4 TaxID=2944939 RepID=UPI00210EBB76|nr:3-hydroxyacyl-ACP dehydratase FabZ [Streptomyces sp. ODS05-4]
MTRPAPAPATAARTYDYGADDIARMLPHRPPMLMLDRAYDVVPGVSGHGVKCVSAGDPCLAGHYPGHPIMPGVLLVEAMAQLVAVVYVADAVEAPGPAHDGDPAASVGYLGSIREMKFSRLVVPGDRLVLEARLGPRLGALRQVTVRASVDRETAAAGTLVVTSGRTARPPAGRPSGGAL